MIYLIHKIICELLDPRDSEIAKDIRLFDSAMSAVVESSGQMTMRQNIVKMNTLVGFDVLILCCGSGLQAKYWQKRLEDGRGSVIAPNTVVLSVEEDWPDGAGNALGTLYAYQNAQKLAMSKFSYDMAAKLIAGEISVGLYHTAGKGTRLAPLPGAENNNKPGVKLPATVRIDGRLEAITILESVIKQTGCYAASRKGRLSVFWGDQVFIPTVPVDYTVTHHADILCSLGPMMNEVEWKEKGMDKYGLIAQSKNGGAAQVEKVSHATAMQLLAGLGEIESVGASLGSFSVSSPLLSALLEEFDAELAAKLGKLDSDPHLWMPMTLTKEAYQQIMTQKGVSAEKSGIHYDRIEKMMARFHENPLSKTLPGVFGPVDVGQGVYWWDYGQLKLYQSNSLLMAMNSNEASLMRSFFGIENMVSNSTLENVTVDDQSVVSNTYISGGGNIRGSVLGNVRCDYIDAVGSILINVTATRIVAPKGCILYNVANDSEEGIVLTEDDVYAGVFSEDGSSHVMRSKTSIDGGKAWEEIVQGNTRTFDEVYKSNTSVCPLTLERVISGAHDSTWVSIGRSSPSPRSPKDKK